MWHNVVFIIVAWCAISLVAAGLWAYAKWLSNRDE